MAEDSISNDDDTSEIVVEWWGARLSKSIASIFAHSTSANSTSNYNDDDGYSTTSSSPPPPIIDVQPMPVPANISTTNTNTTNDWLHFCIMVLLEGKHGKMNISSAYLMQILCIRTPTYAYLSLNLL